MGQQELQVDECKTSALSGMERQALASHRGIHVRDRLKHDVGRVAVKMAAVFKKKKRKGQQRVKSKVTLEELAQQDDDFDVQ